MSACAPGGPKASANERRLRLPIYNIKLTRSSPRLATSFQASATNGSVAWVVQIGGPDDDIAYDVAVSPSGDAAYVAGSFRAQCQFGPGSGSLLKTSRGEYDAFVAKASERERASPERGPAASESLSSRRPINFPLLLTFARR